MKEKVYASNLYYTMLLNWYIYNYYYYYHSNYCHYYYHYYYYYYYYYTIGYSLLSA